MVAWNPSLAALALVLIAIDSRVLPLPVCDPQLLRQVRQLRQLQQVRRFSYTPPKGSGERDNSSFFSLLGLGAAFGCVQHWHYGVCIDRGVGLTVCLSVSRWGISGIAYVYYDPDVLPASIKKWLPIQEPKGHGMSLVEYEQWRAKQGGLAPTSTKKEEEVAAAINEEDDDTAPPSLEGADCRSLMATLVM